MGTLAKNGLCSFYKQELFLTYKASHILTKFWKEERFSLAIWLTTSVRQWKEDPKLLQCRNLACLVTVAGGELHY